MLHKQGIKNCIIKVVLCTFIIFSVLSNTVSYAYAAGSALDEAKALVKQNYIEQVPDSVIDSASSIEELLKALNDPHSMYFTTDEYKAFTDSINNSFVGIGISIEITAEGIKVISTFKDSPAYKAGLISGDIITEADGHSLAGLASDAAVAFIKGQVGTVVHIKVNRNGNLLEFDVAREDINAPTVEGKIIDGVIGYIRLSTFGSDTASQFQTVLDELGKSNPQSYIVDLRDNPGGYLTTAMSMAGFFSGTQPALLVKNRSGAQETYYGSGSVKVIDKPVVFLINKNSASASEILSAVVKDYKKAFIVGTKSYGKGTVQTMFKLSNGDVLKLTVLKFFSPLGNTINKMGISPDLDTSGVDALAAGVLLLGKAPASDKTGYLKFERDGRSFEIDLSKVKKAEYWSVFKKILSSKTINDKLMTGTKNGWVDISTNQQNSDVSIYFPGYKSLSDLKDVAVDKKFTVKFNVNVDASSLSANDIELINEETGEREAAEFENIDSRTIRVIPKKALESGKKYYIVVNNTVKGSTGQVMAEGTVTLVNVK